MKVLGLHHVTAVSARIAENMEFYTGTLGQRLVKKSINQDDISAYHLFYADAVGSPGTDLTFFDWPGAGPNRPGPGTVALTSLRAPGASLPEWGARLTEARLPVESGTDGWGRERLLFTDPEGQRLALVDDSGLPGETVPWEGGVPASLATRGLLSVDIESARPDATRRVLVDLLGFTALDEERHEVRSDGAYGEVRVFGSTGRTPGRVGAGGVHHVAFRVRDDAELEAFRTRIEAAGLGTSGYVDRYYFHSLYFREPGGVLFELATDGPGMDRDEPMATMGERLSIPPFLESRREENEAGLSPLPLPEYLKGRSG